MEGSLITDIGDVCSYGGVWGVWGGIDKTLRG